ncbi:MAG TPA: U32 family peptidase [Ideonella sp.]|uniref:U32 family peptidase n=1 Tax=Ideonella sp. TaxID=1929293 RepID=UPI002E322BEB|nr:U32 family peptidase [Ideonella sp.]HEX5687512.1 U32 family peptidase [Ideonella sp.]
MTTHPTNDTAPPRMAMTVGPVLYHWSRETLLHFYADLADSAADTIVLGEAVCARRRELRLDDWLALGRELQAAGKEVVLVAQTLIESEADLRLLERQGEQQGFAVEAGDASALQLLAGRVPLVLGPHLNIYSREALLEHADLGASRWVAPVELALDALALINPPADPVHTPQGEPIVTEAWAFGRLPLAFSARCFTARHHRVGKDDCGYPCLSDPDGLLLSSTEGQPFLVLNGTQTQSAAVQNLLGDAAALRAAGVSRLRLSPCASGFAQVLRDFDAVMNGDRPAAGCADVWRDLGVPGPYSDGFARRMPGMAWSGA